MRKMNRIGMIATGGAGALALAVGVAMPANAAEHTSTTEESTTTVTSSFDGFRAWIEQSVIGGGNDLTAGNLGIGDIAGGTLVEGPLVSDIGNGAILSGNYTPVLSGNETTAPVLSGNDTNVDAPVASGNEVANDLGSGNVVGSGNDTAVSGNDTGVSVGDIGADVDTMVDDITTEVDDLVDVDGIISGIFD